MDWITRLVYTMSSSSRELMEKEKFSSSLLRTRRQLSTRSIPTFIPSCTQPHTWLDTKIGALGKRSDTFLLNKSCRVKAIDTIRVALPSTGREPTTILSSVSSDGTVNVYDLSLLPPPAPVAIEPSDVPEISPVVTYDSKGSRLTCVTLAEGDVDHAEQHSTEKVAKRKRESDSEAEEEEEWQGFLEGDG
jgi:hypothetical protein